MQGDDKPERDRSKMTPIGTSSAAVDPNPGLSQKSTLPLDTQIQAHIGRRLIAVYDEILQQPVPDRFRLLLDELDQKTTTPDPAPAKSGGGR